MDRKSIIVIAACMVTLVLWVTVVMPKFTPPPRPQPPAGTNLPTATATTPNATNVPVAPTLATASTNVAKLIIATNVPEELVEIANENAHYTFTSHGGGLKLVELLRYPETVAKSRLEPRTNRVATLNTQTPVPTLAVLDGEAVQGDGIFSLTKTATGVRAEKTLANGLTLVKEFSLGTNYLVNAVVRLENRSAEPLSLPAQQWVVGTATPMNMEDNGQYVGVMWYDGAKSQAVGPGYFANKTLGCFPGTPLSEYRRGTGTSNVVWTAVHNQFFTLVAMPQEPAGEVLVQKILLPKPSAEDIARNSRLNRNPEAYVTTLIYPAATIQPNQSLQREFSLFAGPKEYQTLAKIATRFNNNVDLVMNFGFFGFVSKPLLMGMNWLHHSLVLPYGWAIIVCTIIIKLLFWPLTAASTRSMKRMQALQPQMKAIQVKYKDDPIKMNKKTMEFMRENKVSPLGGCLPMMLQMPIFFGFYQMIQTAIELRGAPWLWVADLSRPDTLFMIPGLNFPFNLLPLIMGGTMLWQAHLTPPSPGMDPAQQKIMKYMPLMFLVILYNFSAGLTLYWTVSNLLTILQTKLTKTEPLKPATAPLTPAPKKSK